MCCRYWTDESPEMRIFVEEMNRSSLIDKWRGSAEVRTFGEIRPTNVAPVIAPNRRGERAVFPMRWGFSGRSLLLNARSETAAQKPTFREAWERHRCIVPASWYFEWEHLSKDKYRLWPKDSPLTFLCGLYRIENGLPVFVILTREPGESLRFLHDRMPLILPEVCVKDWIHPGGRPEELLPYAVTELEYEKCVSGETDQSGR